MITRKEYEDLEKRVTELENKQLEAMEEVARYIKDSETLANQVSKRIDDLPMRMLSVLTNNRSA